MDDIEKNRVGYVASIETRMEHAAAELAHYKPIAEKWMPVAHGEMNPDNTNVRITLGFGGKRVTANFDITTFVSNSVEDVTTAVCDTMIKNLVIDQLRHIVEPEVRRLVSGAKSVSETGKW